MMAPCGKVGMAGQSNVPAQVRLCAGQVGEFRDELRLLTMCVSLPPWPV